MKNILGEKVRRLNKRKGEIFIRLLLVGASNFVIAHNHPSGDCTLSKEDINLTKRIKYCADIMGIPLLDHIIIGEGYNSFHQNGLLSS